MKKKENETQLEFIKRIIDGKLVTREIKEDYEELSESIFGEGNCYNSSEVRKRMYGMKYLFELMEEDFGMVATRILTISDCHVPFQLPVETFSNYSGKVDILQLNGDILDCQSVSSFPKVYRVSMLEEMIEARKYIMDLIDLIKPKRVIINYGNHELRFQNYIAKQMGEDMAQLMPMTALDLICDDGFYFYDKRTGSKTWYEPLSKVCADTLEEFTYTGNWYCKIGKVVFCHPRTYKTGILKTAERAMAWFRNEGFDFTGLVMAHTHKIGEFKIGNTVIYEQGTTSDTSKLNYADGLLQDSQKQGYMYICLDKEGEILRDKTKLITIN